MVRNSKKNIIVGSIGIIFFIILDQITKIIAETVFAKNSISLIPGVFEFTYLKNQSAAFSMDPVTLLNKIFHFTYFQENPQAFLNCKMWFFYVITVILTVLIYLLFLHLPKGKRYFMMNLICVLFVSGAIGNFIDRVKQQYVTDFLYFSLINFPVFNVADIYVTVAAFAFIIFGLFYYKEEDYAKMFSFKKGK